MRPRPLPNAFPTAPRPRLPNAPERRPTAPVLSLYYYVIPGAAPRVAPRPKGDGYA